MSLDHFSYTKSWNSPTDFPTVETSEEQVRADFQELHDQALGFINETVDYINALDPSRITNNDIDSITNN